MSFFLHFQSIIFCVVYQLNYAFFFIFLAPFRFNKKVIDVFKMVDLENFDLIKVSMLYHTRQDKKIISILSVHVVHVFGIHIVQIFKKLSKSIQPFSR